MKLSDLPIGTKLELQVYNNLGERMQPMFVSQLEWLEENMVACIAAPISGGILYPLHIDCEMSVYFFFNNNLYRFKAVMIGRDNNNNLALLKIKVISNFERIQRREFFRFDWSLPVKYRVVDSDDVHENDKCTFNETITKDISGGGLCILMEDKLALNKLVECEIKLDKTHKIRFLGKVVRACKIETECRYKYEIGILYKKIENNDREAIIGGIFKEQRKLRKKGLI